MAVALMQTSGFSKHDCSQHHTRVATWTCSKKRVAHRNQTGDNIPLLPRDELMDQCVINMTAYGVGCVGIVDEAGRLRGRYHRRRPTPPHEP